uniref:AlNc14C349G10895 protein n=1 Tax=Albugo laibachii Nc14 TaxID=890382 RepID=F0WXE3_9STRA|nr:AlNc14C349G10895 [Albugo laibachii Nc14]|eukprot:CCA26135.1 AlNc14C349G10895 [Albugo laibachii Nc14]
MRFSRFPAFQTLNLDTTPANSTNRLMIQHTNMRISSRQYIILFTSALGSLFAGSSVMHLILKPDLTIPNLSKEISSEEKENIVR